MRQYREALSHLRLSIDEICMLNWMKRKAIVEYAYSYIPFYKSFYESNGFHPSMLKSEEDWIKVPILEKEIVRNNVESMKNPDVKSSIVGYATTGGSTGMPLKIYVDKRFHWEILGWRMFKLWGISPAANMGIIHRRVPNTYFAKVKNRLLWFPTRRAYLNASAISEISLRKFICEIRDKKIEWLQGYVGGLENLADYIINNHIELHHLKLVWSTSAPLLKHVRRKLERAFHCKIMDQYGCCEIANIAMQGPACEHLHINCDVVYVEAVSNGQRVIDEEGELLVTNLESKVFPLIRYRLGDKGTLLSHHCRCGNPFPLLKQIEGRISDAIYTPKGLYVDGCYLTTLFDEFSELFSQFQLYQAKDYSITLKVKIYQDNIETRKALKKIQSILEKNTNYEIPIRILVVEHIDDDRGKIRYIISEIALNKNSIM